MPALLLQKLGKTSISREQLDTLERRLELWERSEIKYLLLEVQTIQQRLTSNNDPKNITDVSKKFAKLMGKENTNGALKLLTIIMTNGILPLGKKTV